MNPKEPLFIDADDGDQLPVRDLGPGDIFTIQRMVGQALQTSADRSSIAESLVGAKSTSEFLAQTIMAICHVEKPLISWLNSLVGRPKLSLTEVGKLLEVLADHPDLLNFLGSLRRIMKGSPAAKLWEKLMEKASEKAKSSTLYKDVMDGLTPTS